MIANEIVFDDGEGCVETKKMMIMNCTVNFVPYGLEWNDDGLFPCVVTVWWEYEMRCLAACGLVMKDVSERVHVNFFAMRMNRDCDSELAYEVALMVADVYEREPRIVLSMLISSLLSSPSCCVADVRSQYAFASSQQGCRRCGKASQRNFMAIEAVFSVVEHEHGARVHGGKQIGENDGSVLAVFSHIPPVEVLRENFGNISAEEAELERKQHSASRP
eukprot:768792-Hanusia_phi.AAC.15